MSGWDMAWLKADRPIRPGQDPMRMSSNQINDMMRLFRRDRPMNNPNPRTGEDPSNPYGLSTGFALTNHRAPPPPMDNDPMRLMSDDLIRRSQQEHELRYGKLSPSPFLSHMPSQDVNTRARMPQHRMRAEAGHNALNRQMQQQMQRRQRMPQPNQGYGNRFPGMQFSGPFSQPMMPQNYGMGGGYRQPQPMPYPQPRMPYPQPMPQPGYGGGYSGGFGGRGPGGGYGNMYAQQPQMYGGGYPPQPPIFGGGTVGMLGQQPQYGGGFGGGMQGGYGQPQRQPQYQNASPFGGQMNQRQQPQQMAQQMGGFGGGIMRSFY